MIYTCTITPSIDYTTYLSSFLPGELNRTKEVYYYPGGKGINVSRVLKRLGEDNTALGFVGGFTGEYIKHFLEQENIKTEFIDTEEITRINVKIKADQETELNGPGPMIAEHQQQELLSKLQHLQKGDWLVLAGSLPETIPLSFYKEIANLCRQLGIKIVLDTSGPAFNELVKERPFLIKPNEHELGDLFDTTISSKEEAIHYAKKLNELGVENIIVSLGGDGAIFVSNDTILEAKAPKGKVVNTVGAGDSLLSGFISSYAKGQGVPTAFRYGVASGSATAFQTDLCKKEDVEALIDQVQLKSIKE
ncbi:1-phosphofructokinase [Salinibacillus xinjiangensis]|uniref:Tagatose-6-phosphate kinase n=1 Tax=Salinibacillus xinjiangensis TaxID=1229268 RepID=A0A6G1XBS6_9BACI|nr:1-phosphofructokinase [Salinibacillus xinjiangensis]MRG88330.1 1-phosphofructokinase [Salinibacillus xinjiangensis]